MNQIKSILRFILIKSKCQSKVPAFVIMLYNEEGSECIFQRKMYKGVTRKEELAAVTVPYGLTKAAFSRPICSNEDGRTPLSFTIVSFPERVKHVKRLKVQDICCVESLPVKFNLLHFCNSWLGPLLLILLNRYRFSPHSLPMDHSFSYYLFSLLLYLQDFLRSFLTLPLSRKPFPTR